MVAAADRRRDPDPPARRPRRRPACRARPLSGQAGARSGAPLPESKLRAVAGRGPQRARSTAGGSSRRTADRVGPFHQPYGSLSDRGGPGRAAAGWGYQQCVDRHAAAQRRFLRAAHRGCGGTGGGAAGLAWPAEPGRRAQGRPPRVEFEHHACAARRRAAASGPHLSGHGQRLRASPSRNAGQVGGGPGRRGPPHRPRGQPRGDQRWSPIRGAQPHPR